MRRPPNSAPWMVIVGNSRTTSLVVACDGHSIVRGANDRIDNMPHTWGTTTGVVFYDDDCP